MGWMKRLHTSYNQRWREDCFADNMVDRKLYVIVIVIDTTLGQIINSVYSVWRFFMEPVVNLFPLHWPSVSGQLNYDLFHWGLRIETTALAKAGLSFEGDFNDKMYCPVELKIKCLYIERHIVWLIWSRLSKLFFKFESCTWLSVIFVFLRSMYKQEFFVLHDLRLSRKPCLQKNCNMELSTKR